MAQARLLLQETSGPSHYRPTQIAYERPHPCHARSGKGRTSLLRHLECGCHCPRFRRHFAPLTKVNLSASTASRRSACAYSSEFLFLGLNSGRRIPHSVTAIRERVRLCVSVTKRA